MSQVAFFTWHGVSAVYDYCFKHMVGMLILPGLLANQSGARFESGVRADADGHLRSDPIGIGVRAGFGHHQRKGSPPMDILRVGGSLAELSSFWKPSGIATQNHPLF